MKELASWGALGETLFTEFEPPMNGPGLVASGAAPLAIDPDGMPDYREAGLGLSTRSPSNNDPSPGGSGHTPDRGRLHGADAPGR